MDDFTDINRRLESLIRLGTIAQVDHAKARVRVQSGKLTSEWLPWLALRAGTSRLWDPPSPGEQCLMLSQSGNTAAGIVLVGLFSDTTPAPSASPDLFVRDFPDGAVVRYNHKTGDLAITGVKTVTVQAADRLTVDCPDSHFTGDVTIDKSLAVMGDSLTHQGINVGADHGHTFTQRGKDISGPPA